MKVVVDSNILFSALLSARTRMAEVLLDSRFHFIAPHFLFTEIFKHKEKILKHTRLSEDELLELLGLLLSNVQFISHNQISAASIQKAIKLCNSVDLNDVPFVALCIEFNAQLWSGDVKLKSALAAHNFIQIFNLP